MATQQGGGQPRCRGLTAGGVDDAQETSPPPWDPHLMGGGGLLRGGQAQEMQRERAQQDALPLAAEAAGLRLNLESTVNDGVMESRCCYL